MIDNILSKKTRKYVYGLMLLCICHRSCIKELFRTFIPCLC